MRVIRLPCARPIGSRKAIAPRHALRHIRHYVRASGNWSVVKRAFISKSSPENIPFDKRWDRKRFAHGRNFANSLEVSLAMQHGIKPVGATRYSSLSKTFGSSLIRSYLSVCLLEEVLQVGSRVLRSV